MGMVLALVRCCFLLAWKIQLIFHRKLRTYQKGQGISDEIFAMVSEVKGGRNYNYKFREGGREGGREERRNPTGFKETSSLLSL